MQGHSKDEWFLKYPAECTLCKRKGPLVRAWRKKTRESQAESWMFSLKSANELREARDQDLVEELCREEEEKLRS